MLDYDSSYLYPSEVGVHIYSKDRRVWISRRWMSPHHECRLGFRPVIANNQRQLAWPKRRSRFAQSGQLEKRQLEVKTAHEVAYARSTTQDNTERDRHLPRRNKNAFQFQIDCQSLIIVIVICFLLLFRCCCCVVVVAAVVTITRCGVKYSCEFLSNWRPHNAFETPPPQDICGTFLYLFFLRFPPSCPRRGETLKTPGVVPSFETSKISR